MKTIKIKRCSCGAFIPDDKPSCKDCFDVFLVKEEFEGKELEKLTIEEKAISR